MHQKKGAVNDDRIHRPRSGKRNNAKVQMFRLHERQVFGLSALPTSQTFAEISKIPTADVVQKSEYSRLEKSFNELKQEAKGYLNRIYGIRTDVAMEIFDDIDKILKTQERYLYCNSSLVYVYELIGELKKKYI